jgi:DnaK suppressor protein
MTVGNCLGYQVFPLLLFPPEKIMLSVPAASQVPNKRQSAKLASDRALATEAQLLAMPAAEYMSAVQLEFFRCRLLELEESHLKRARGIVDEMATGAAGADPVDRASAEEEHTMAVCGRLRDASHLQKARAALKRIQDGEYGYCEETGEPIGLRRLLIEPAATLTIEAQERHENRCRRFRTQG